MSVQSAAFIMSEPWSNTSTEVTHKKGNESCSLKLCRVTEDSWGQNYSKIEGSRWRPLKDSRPSVVSLEHHMSKCRTMELLPTPVNEYNKQRTEARFTVRSANSPTYSLIRRPGVRKARAFSEERWESAEESKDAAHKKDISEYQARPGSGNSFIDRYEERETSRSKMSASMAQNGTADKTVTNFGTNRGRNYNPSSETRGRTEWRGHDLPSRSKSLDWRTGAKSPDQRSRPLYMSGSSKQRAKISKQGEEGVEGSRISSIKTPNSSGPWSFFQEKSQETLDRASRGRSLPYKLKLLSGPGSDFRETASPSETKGGQSILERIEKLYGSAGFTEDCSKTRQFSTTERDECDGKGHGAMLHHKGSGADFHISPQQRLCDRAAGGTFPRRFSLGEKSPEQSRKSFVGTPRKDNNPLNSDSSLSPKTKRARERIAEGEWQDQIQNSYSEVRGSNCGRGFLETGTRSLDRARSRNTLAAQIRLAQAASGITAPPQSNTSLEEASASHPSGSKVRGASRSNDQVKVNHDEEKDETNRIKATLRDTSVLKTERIKEPEKEKGMADGARGETESRWAKTDTVFDSNSQKIKLKTVGKTAYPEKPLVASVRNKINQFEALTQRAQSSTKSQIMMPRRAFSVPTQLSSSHDGVKKSGGLGDKWGGLKEEGKEDAKAEEKVANGGTRLQQRRQSNRSLSMDEVGLRIENKKIEGDDSPENEGSDVYSCQKLSDEFWERSRLKHTLKLPLNGGTQQLHCDFYIDETDFCKVSSPEEAGDADTSLLRHAEPTGPKETTPTGIISPVSDDDLTPTNTPNYSPFLSPDSPAENATSVAAAESKSTSSFTRADQTTEKDSSSHSSLPNLHADSPDGKKQTSDLETWISGWNSKIKVWNDDDDDDDAFDDDDESTQKDEDSNYDSDSGESSVTITSTISQSDRRSFCVSLSDLCNFAGVDCESENDSDDWQSKGRRSASMSSDMSALSYVSVLPSEELDRLLEDVRGFGDGNLQDDVQVVVLHKEVGAGLGFTMAGGVDQNKPITVHKVFHTGVAAEEGSIREGDQVLSINGTALGGYAHWEALRVLRRAKTREMGVVVLRRGGVSCISKGGVQTNPQCLTETQKTEEGQHMCVRLEKNSRDLGFSLEGGAGLESRPLTIQKIFQGGPVDKVRPGDEVLEIEGVSMVGMRRLEAWTLIRRLPPGPVDVVLNRPLKHMEGLPKDYQTGSGNNKMIDN